MDAAIERALANKGALGMYCLSVDYADKEHRPPLPVVSKGHWLDRLEQGVQA